MNLQARASIASPRMLFRPASPGGRRTGADVSVRNWEGWDGSSARQGQPALENVSTWLDRNIGGEWFWCFFPKSRAF